MDQPHTENTNPEYPRDFMEFLKHVKIEHADTHETVTFAPWEHQKATARALDAGQWLLILKARQLGFTWLLAAYSVWITRQARRRVLVFNQDKEYASDFLDRCRFIHDQLPPNLQRKATTDNRTRLEFDEEHHGSYIRALAATKRAAHSISANLVICDEAAYIGYLERILRAAMPTLETHGGQAVVLSTSNGPSGHFWRLWTKSSTTEDTESTEKGKQVVPSAVSSVVNLRSFKPLFFPWHVRPGRTQEWYDREKANNAHDPTYMRREYPLIAEEAFEAAEGRVYPLFSAYGEAGGRFMRRLFTPEKVGETVKGEVEEGAKALALQSPVLPLPVSSSPCFPASVVSEWKHYRAIDFGAVDPFVCLWACVVPGDPAGLTIDPSCAHTIREMLAYSYVEKDRPKDEDNHAPDALRYLIISPGPKGLNGHVHVYRELYVPDSTKKGLSLPRLADWIKELSGTQHFDLTVADRSRPDCILQLCQYGIRTVAPRVLSGGRGGELAQGIIRVNTLITATAKGDAACQPPALPGITPPVPPRFSFNAAKFAHRPAVFG